MAETSSESAAQAEIKERLNADWQWLAERGIRLSQWGPDPVSGKVRVYLQRYSDEARQVLENRYGQDIVVESESRMWSTGLGQHELDLPQVGADVPGGAASSRPD